jgi:chromosome segregation ATPase
MAIFKGRGNEELRRIVDGIERGKGELEMLIEQSNSSVRELNRLSGPLLEVQRTMDSINSRLSRLEEGMGIVDRLGTELQQVQGEAENLASTHSRIELQLAHAADEATRIADRMGALDDHADRAIKLKDDIAGFLAQGDPLGEVRAEAEQIGRQAREVGDGFARVRERQDEMTRAYDHAMSRLGGLQEEQGAALRSGERLRADVDTIQETIEELREVGKGVADTRHELGTLKALADQVTQKKAALERQRDMIDRAADQASHLSETMRQIDDGLEAQEQRRASLSALESDVAKLQTLHETVLASSDEIEARQHEIQEMEEAARGDLGQLQEQLRRNVERFELENRGLETVTERIADLRKSLLDAEARFEGLEGTGTEIEELTSRTEGLVTQVGSVGSELERLAGDGERVRALQAELGQLSHGVESLTQAVGRLEQARPSIDAGLEDLGNLNRSRESVKESLDQMRLVYKELMRTREGQAETEAWLSNTEGGLSALREQVGELTAMQPTLDALGRKVEQVDTAMAEIESRRGFVEQVQGRLGELGSLASEIEARSTGLQARMETVESQFGSLCGQAEEAERVSEQMSTVATAVERADKRLTEVAKVIFSLENRSEDLQNLSERARFLGRQLDQRQVALEKAMEHLERASAMRQESAADVQRLEELSASITGDISLLEMRAQHLESTGQGLEQRSRDIDQAQQRIEDFEARLAKWERSESEVARALAQLESRRSTVDTLQADLKHMFEMAERTVEDARQVAAARNEIQTTRGELEVVLERLRDTKELGGSLEERRRKIERAEKKLARADALLIEIQSSIETLEGQKSLVDFVLEKAGALTFQAKQAEALIETLREERELTNRMQGLEKPTDGDGSGVAEAG